MTWDLMTGNVTEMEQAYERQWAREWEDINEPIRDQSGDRGLAEPGER